MPILLALGSTLLLALVFGPSIWVRYVFKKYGVERPDLPGTGGEFARHLLDEAKLADVKVEIMLRATTTIPARAPCGSSAIIMTGNRLRRSPSPRMRCRMRSNMPMASRLSFRRSELINQLVWVERLAVGVLLLAPAVFVLLRSPVALVLELLAGVALMGIAVLVHLATLPVEFDASFGKALPVLEARRYLGKRDLPAARTVLRAAAFTYVAAALNALINVVRRFRSF